MCLDFVSGVVFQLGRLCVWIVCGDVFQLGRCVFGLCVSCCFPVRALCV